MASFISLMFQASKKNKISELNLGIHMQTIRSVSSVMNVTSECCAYVWEFKSADHRSL